LNDHVQPVLIDRRKYHPQPSPVDGVGIEVLDPHVLDGTGHAQTLQPLPFDEPGEALSEVAALEVASVLGDPRMSHLVGHDLAESIRRATGMDPYPRHLDVAPRVCQIGGEPVRIVHLVGGLEVFV
jgi:hypothetical protein